MLVLAGVKAKVMLGKKSRVRAVEIFMFGVVLCWERIFFFIVHLLFGSSIEGN